MNYSKVNINDVEPSEMAAETGIDARFARKHLDSRDLGVSLFRYPAGMRQERGHRHREQEEAYLVVRGSGELLVDGEIVPLAEWDLVRVAPEAVRAFAAGPAGLDVVAVGGPKPEGGDGVRADVSWPS